MNDIKIDYNHLNMFSDDIKVAAIKYVSKIPEGKNKDIVVSIMLRASLDYANGASWKEKECDKLMNAYIEANKDKVYTEEDLKSAFLDGKARIVNPIFIGYNDQESHFPKYATFREWLNKFKGISPDK